MYTTYNIPFLFLILSCLRLLQALYEVLWWEGITFNKATLALLAVLHEMTPGGIVTQQVPVTCNNTGKHTQLFASLHIQTSLHARRWKGLFPCNILYSMYIRMFVCMYVCMYVCINLHTYVDPPSMTPCADSAQLHACTHARIHAHKHPCLIKPPSHWLTHND